MRCQERRPNQNFIPPAFALAAATKSATVLNPRARKPPARSARSPRGTTAAKSFARIIAEVRVERRSDGVGGRVDQDCGAVGIALAMMPAAVVPPAPGRSRRRYSAELSRNLFEYEPRMTSVTVPGANGTTTRIGRDGQLLWAKPANGISESASADQQQAGWPHGCPPLRARVHRFVSNAPDCGGCHTDASNT